MKTVNHVCGVPRQHASQGYRVMAGFAVDRRSGEFMKEERVDEVILPKEAGGMERFLALNEFEPEARQRLPRAVYEYVAGGAGEEYSIRANEESYQRIFLRPRVLRPVAPVDLGQELFGRPLPAPVLLAPGAYQRLMHPEGLALSRAQSATACPLSLAQMRRCRSRRPWRCPELGAGSRSTCKATAGLRAIQSRGSKRLAARRYA